MGEWGVTVVNVHSENGGGYVQDALKAGVALPVLAAAPRRTVISTFSSDRRFFVWAKWGVCRNRYPRTEHFPFRSEFRPSYNSWISSHFDDSQLQNSFH